MATVALSGHRPMSSGAVMVTFKANAIVDGVTNVYADGRLIGHAEERGDRVVYFRVGQASAGVEAKTLDALQSRLATEIEYDRPTFVAGRKSRAMGGVKSR